MRRPLVGASYGLSDDESEERTVAWRPRIAIHYATLYVRYSTNFRHLKLPINAD
ncbi:hypothetical protein [Methylomonas albis]|nr:hypothetical protein [Methylomonas albis]